MQMFGISYLRDCITVCVLMFHKDTMLATMIINMYEPLKEVFFTCLHFSGIIMSFPACIHIIIINIQ